MRSMLEAIPASVGRSHWRDIVWAVADTGWGCAKDLARSWSETCPDKWDEAAFEGVWESFENDRLNGVHFGTLDYHAKQHGWKDPLPSGRLQFSGLGKDVHNGDKFAEMFRGKLLYVPELDEWLKFEAVTGWRFAGQYEQDRAARAVLDALREEAVEHWSADPSSTAAKRMMSHVEYTSKYQNLQAMIKVAKAVPDLSAPQSKLDRNPKLLGVSNGVLDLDTGEIKRSIENVLITKRAEVCFVPGAPCPRFERFMEEIQPDLDRRQFLQRFLGYCMTGCVNEQVFAMFYGGGANGKSVLIELIAWLLGGYSLKMESESLMAHKRNPQAPSPDLAALAGIRFSYANETEEGRKLDAARLKDLTGGDTITARVPYGKAAVSFSPTHKLVIVGNHRPDVRDQSEGMWRRLLLVPFEVSIPAEQRENNLIQVLKAEGSGILNWLIAGVQAWSETGLNVPACIRAETAEYRRHEDVLGEFIDEFCVLGGNLSAKKSDLYSKYRTWAEDNGHGPVSSTRLTRQLRDRGVEVAADKRTFNGISLVAP